MKKKNMTVPQFYFYLANDNVYVWYISCIIFCYAITQVRLSFFVQ